MKLKAWGDGIEKTDGKSLSLEWKRNQKRKKGDEIIHEKLNDLIVEKRRDGMNDKS